MTYFINSSKNNDYLIDYVNYLIKLQSLIDERCKIYFDYPNTNEKGESKSFELIDYKIDSDNAILYIYGTPGEHIIGKLSDSNGYPLFVTHITNNKKINSLLPNSNRASENYVFYSPNTKIDNTLGILLSEEHEFDIVLNESMSIAHLDAIKMVYYFKEINYNKRIMCNSYSKQKSDIIKHMIEKLS